MSDILIPSDKVISGINLSLKNARDHLEASFQIYGKKYFQQAIPLSIISYEESSKANYLISFLWDKKDITDKEWKNVTQHKFKLTQFEEKIKESLQNKSNLEAKFVEYFLKDTFGEALSINDNVDYRKNLLIDLDKLQRLKEICLYSDWSIKHMRWNNFLNLPPKFQSSLAYLVIILAEDIYHKTMYALDIYRNPPKPSGIRHTEFDEKSNTLTVIHDYKDLKNRKAVKNIQKFQKTVDKNTKVIADGLIALKALVDEPHEK